MQIIRNFECNAPDKSRIPGVMCEAAGEIATELVNSGWLINFGAAVCGSSDSFAAKSCSTPAV